MQSLLHDPYVRAPNKNGAVRPMTGMTDNLNRYASWRARVAGLARALGANTLLGRFSIAAVLLLSLLVILAWGVNNRVTEVSGGNADRLADRHRVDALTSHMSNEIWEVEQTLQRYMLSPTSELRDKFDTLLAHLAADDENLAQTKWVRGTPGAREKTESLLRDLLALRGDGLRLMALRSSPMRAFPAMPTMVNTMSPLALEFFSAAGLALDETQERIAQPSQVDAQRFFYDAVYSWSRMITAFRTFASNRFAIFDASSDQGMSVQADLVEDYAERVTRSLAALADLEKRGLLQFQQGISLEQMRTYHRQWHKAWRDVQAVWTSESWRLDTQMLQNNVQPLITRIWHGVRDIEGEVDAHSTGDLSLLARVAANISGTLWFAVLLGLAATIIMFALFEAQIRRPIARVVAALKAEAAGHTDVAIPDTTLQETRDLALAFEHMRREVRVRQDSLNARELRLRTILDNTAEGIITFDEHGKVEGFNQSAEKLFGWAEHEVIGFSVAQFISPESREIRDDYLDHFMRAEIQRLIGHEGELSGRHKDGSNFPMAVKISGMQLDNRQKYIAMVSNISERKALMENLRMLAEHDGLTGLYNRSYFHGELERVVERVRRSEVVNCALLYIDLDHFKYVNDTLGHAAGDKLLIEVASILNRRARKSDLVVRLGGDEFTVLVYDTDPTMVEKVADSFRRQLADYSFNFEGQSVTIGCSIGVAVIEPTMTSPAEVMSRADLACHLAKRGGRNQVHVFVPEDAKNVTSMTLDMGWSRRIREAIEHNRFALVVQPIVNTRTRAISTYEVLIRMQDDSGQYIMPGGFLPTAERFGLSLDIDLWVIENAIDALARLRATTPDLNYTINLSAQTLNSPLVCDFIQEKITAVGLDASALIFEVTETVAISDMSAAVTLLSRLRALGCRTALDDFGSGMSSFAYLKELPVDIVKIDGRFVKHIATNPIDQAMVRAMNDIAHALGKETIAEFVEDEAAFQVLIELGIDYGQGYHLGRPESIAPPAVSVVRASGTRRR